MNYRIIVFLVILDLVLGLTAIGTSIFSVSSQSTFTGPISQFEKGSGSCILLVGSRTCSITVTFPQAFPVGTLPNVTLTLATASPVQNGYIMDVPFIAGNGTILHITNTFDNLLFDVPFNNSIIGPGQIYLTGECLQSTEPPGTFIEIDDSPDNTNWLQDDYFYLDSCMGTPANYGGVFYNGEHTAVGNLHVSTRYLRIVTGYGNSTGSAVIQNLSAVIKAQNGNCSVNQGAIIRTAVAVTVLCTNPVAVQTTMIVKWQALICSSNPQFQNTVGTWC
jgi:hypothetical protein